MIFSHCTRTVSENENAGFGFGFKFWGKKQEKMIGVIKDMIDIKI